jgi:hypothetical protein
MENMKMKMGYDVVDWVQLAQERIQWQAFMGRR